MQLKPGARLRSQVCDTEVVVVKAPTSDVDLRCGGSQMVDPKTTNDESIELDENFAAGSLLGKRYADEAIGIELLCSRAGAGSLSVASLLLEVKGAKALPSSD
jgi:hypothetical protein